MGQIEDLRLFAMVVENRSISRAADKLGIAKSAVSRRLGLLEDRYASRLIDRDPGNWEVTATGRELYQRAVRAVTEVDEIESDFKDVSHNIAGPLTVSIPREFGNAYLMPALLAFRKRYPEILLTVDFEDRTIDLSRENYDLAIRISANEQTGVVATKIGTSLHHLCASPGYLATHGTPQTLNDLQDHSLLQFGRSRRAEWEFLDDKGKSTKVEFYPTLNSNNGHFLINAAEQGFGIVRMPDFLSQPALTSGTLVEILPEVRFREWGIYFIHAEDRRLNSRMRLFQDEIKTVCMGGG